MSLRINVILIIVLFIFEFSYSQNHEFGNITHEELAVQSDPMFPDVDAIVLHRDVYARVGNYVEVYEKIKILTEEGLDYASKEIPFFEVSKIKGNTHNLINGNIETTKLPKNQIFTEKTKIQGHIYRSKKVTFPKVKVGSIIELSYHASTGSFEDIKMQYEIPIKKLTIEAVNVSASTYRFVQNPNAFLKVHRQDYDHKLFLSTTNVPPLEYENYVYDMELYRAKLQIKRLGGNRTIMFDKWEQIPKILNELDAFAFQVRPRKIYRDEISEVIGNEDNPLEQIKLVYNYIKETIEWNGYFGIYPDSGTRDTFRKKEGDVSDINMLFVSMLRSLDIEAYPILASSKMNGIHLTASREAFNYTLVGAKIQNKLYILDAANPRATFDYIPQYMINFRGMMIKDDDSYEWVDLTKAKNSYSRMIADTKLDEDLTLSGRVREKKTGYFGIGLREALKNTNIEKDSLLYANVAGLQYKNIDFKVDDNSANTEINYEFNLEDAAEEVGNDIYLSPLFFLSLTENPFKKSSRIHPIDFGHPFNKSYNISIKLPEGYKPSFIPEKVLISMPDNLGSYQYQISHQGHNLQVMMRFKVKAPILSVDYYPALKEFFSRRVDKESEKVILTRS